MTDIKPLLVTVKEAARVIGVPTYKVYELLNEGQLNGKYIGRSRKVVYASVEGYVAELPDDPEVAS